MATVIDYEVLRRQSHGRLAVEDMQLLERACAVCSARTILEIGAADGGSSVILAAQAAKRAGRLYSIEGNPKAGMMANLAVYGLQDRCTLLPAWSPWLGPLEQEIPPVIDLLFIDGRHDIRWCLMDYHYWQPRVRPGGVIVFHDTGGMCREDRAQTDFGSPGYLPLVRRAIALILATDLLVQIDASDGRDGGAIAYRKGVAL